MVNDINTLNGALQELGETLADNLVAKGVSASASDGLTTLANKVLDIQTGGGSCYNIAFSEDLYIAVGGSVTLECTLQQNYSPLANATVTLSDGTSQYSSITNSQGIATFNLTGLVSSATYTCSYSNVSDNCTITVPQYLFYDECNSADGLTNYGAIRPISSSTTTSQLEYNSTENAYYVHANGDWGIIPITALNGLDNYKITAEFKTKSSGNTYQGGLGFIAESGTNNLIFRKYGTTSNIIVNSSSEVSIGSITNASSRWHKFEIIKQGRHYTVTLTDMTSGNVVGTTSYIYSSDTYYVGLMTVAGTNYGSYVRNIKVESIPLNYLIYDDASVDNSSTLFGSSISLRNSGTNSVSYDSSTPCYVLKNTRSSSESLRPYTALEGYTDSFKMTVRSKCTSSSACPISLYYYLDSNNWGGVKDEHTNIWVSSKTNGSFTESNKRGTNHLSSELTDEFIYNSTSNTLTINRYYNGVIEHTQVMNIPVTITSSVKWGTTLSWDNNATCEVYEIIAEPI